MNDLTLGPVNWDVWRRFLVAAAVWLLTAGSAGAAELYVGAAEVSITPDKPVALSGQRRLRLADTVESPVMAAALALESRDGGKAGEQAIFVACDLVAIRGTIIDEVREKFQRQAPEFDARKLIISATHTHTAPVMEEGRYAVPEQGVMQPADYREFLIARLVEVANQAWQARRRARAGWGLGHAVIANNRRATYFDGTAQMYGKTDRPDFRGIEGYEDHGVEVLFFWNEQDELVATAINVACPAQEVESRSAINADYWHPVRETLRQQHGEQLVVLGWIGAGGDQSPRPMFRKAAEERMRELRGLTRLDELARRILQAWDEAHAGAWQDQRADVVLAHHVQPIKLPVRQVTQDEMLRAKSEIAQLAGDPAKLWDVRWRQRVVDRFEQQRPDSTYAMQLNVVRVGDVAIATNDFELYTEYGIRIKARSPALQTFLIQLAGPGSYLPTAPAVAGGGYSATAESNLVGPEGGRVLVDSTVDVLHKLWP